MRSSNSPDFTGLINGLMNGALTTISVRDSAMVRPPLTTDSGMNVITKINFKQGFAPPRFAGKDGFMSDGKLIPAFAKIRNGTPYVNPLNFI